MLLSHPIQINVEWEGHWNVVSIVVVTLILSTIHVTPLLQDLPLLKISIIIPYELRHRTGIWSLVTNTVPKVKLAEMCASRCSEASGVSGQ